MVLRFVRLRVSASSVVGYHAIVRLRDVDEFITPIPTTMASRDALPLPTDGLVFEDRPDPAPLGDPANTAPGHGFPDRHVFVDGRGLSAAAAYLQSASTPFQNHRTQVPSSPSSPQSRARVSLSGDGRRVDSAAAIQFLLD